MSNFNSSKNGSIGSTNISISKHKQTREIEAQIEQNQYKISKLAAGADPAAYEQKVLRLNEQSEYLWRKLAKVNKKLGRLIVAGEEAAGLEETEIIPTPGDCTETGECAAGFSCVNGACIPLNPLGDDRLQGPGDCVLPASELPDNQCGGPDSSGACAKPTCGEEVGAEPGTLSCCGGTVYSGYVPRIKKNALGDDTIEQTWTESCEPFDKECDQYADSWFKSTGSFPSGYEDAELVCSSCSECLQGGICFPISKGFAPCYCNYGVCKDEQGPCYDCDFESGDCEETCTGCQANCNQLFTCNCDRSQEIFQAQGSFNPCTGSGCWEATSEYIQNFCKQNFDCEDPDDPCIGDCDTLKGTGGYPPCPAGKSCKQAGFMRNEETGQTTYFLVACAYKEDCGCDAPPDSPLFRPCGPCQICKEGTCVRDPLCGFEKPGSYTVEYYDYQKYTFEPRYCNGRPYDSNGSLVVFLGGPCDPEELGCNNVSGSTTDVVYQTDGIFNASGGGSGTISRPCGVGSEQLTNQDVGSVTYQLKHPIREYANGPVIYFLLVTYNENLTITTGTSPTQAQPHNIQDTLKIKRIVYNGPTSSEAVTYYESELPLTGGNIQSQVRV